MAPPPYGPELERELRLVTWRRSTRTRLVAPPSLPSVMPPSGPPEWLSYLPLEANLAGLPIGGGLRAEAGAVAVVTPRTGPPERWAVIAVRVSPRVVEWSVARLG